MANFNLFKKKAAETAETIAGKSASFAKNVAEKTKVLAQKAKISAEIAAEKETLKKAYLELGKQYFERYGADVPEDLEQAVEAINLSIEKIAIKNDELDKLKEPAELEEECECCADGECTCEETAECECCAEEATDESKEAE